MLVTYCDICGQPIKDVKIIFERVAVDIVAEAQVDRYNNPIIKKESNEICRTCNTMISEMFKHRMYNLCEQAEELRKIYNLPTKKSENEKKKKNNKKNKE